MAKPSLDALWKAFPDHAAYPTLKDLYAWLGGTAEKNIFVPGFGPEGNTCASRLSVAFNDGGAPIDNLTPFDDAFRGKRGVVAFSVNWHDASGNIALFNGATYREPTHDNYASYISASDPKVRTTRGEFWELR